MDVNVWLPDIVSFIETFFTLSEPANMIAQYQAKITIVIPWYVDA
jgi:hypothetical protein